MGAFFRVVYLLIALVIIGGYAYSAFRGFELVSVYPHPAPAGIRGRAGVAPVYWYGGGFRGGK